MMERLRYAIQRAVYRLRNDRRRRTLVLFGIIGLSILVAVMVDGMSIILTGREMALLVGGIFIGVEYCLGYQIEQERLENNNNKNTEVIDIDVIDD